MVTTQHPKANITPPPAHPTDTASTSSSLSLGQGQRNRRQQALVRNSRSLDESIDRAIVQVLLSPNRLLKFSHVCKDREDIFGTPHSNHRRQVQNRRDHLLRLQRKDPDAFLALALEFGLIDPTGVETPTTPQAAEEEEELLDSSPKSSSSESEQSSSSAFHSRQARSLRKKRLQFTQETKSARMVNPVFASLEEDGGYGMLSFPMSYCFVILLLFSHLPPRYHPCGLLLPRKEPRG